MFFIETFQFCRCIKYCLKFNMFLCFKFFLQKCYYVENHFQPPFFIYLSPQSIVTFGWQRYGPILMVSFVSWASPRVASGGKRAASSTWTRQQLPEATGFWHCFFSLIDVVNADA